jgi:hypothetical protein
VGILGSRGAAQHASINDEETGFDDEEAVLIDSLMFDGDGGGSGQYAGERGWLSPSLASLGAPRVKISPLLVRSWFQGKAISCNPPRPMPPCEQHPVHVWRTPQHRSQDEIPAGSADCGRLRILYVQRRLV